MTKKTNDMPYKNPYLFMATGPNRMGSSLTDREIVIVSVFKISMTVHIAMTFIS